MHEYMCEGITLYYKIMDAYDAMSQTVPKGRKHKAWQTPIEEVLFKVGSTRHLNIVLLVNGSKVLSRHR